MKRILFLFLSALLINCGIRAQFAAMQLIDSSSKICTGLVAADLNKDSLQDILISKRGFNENYLKYYENRGNGVFDSGTVIFHHSFAPLSPNVADLNADNWPDIAFITGASANGRLYVMHSDQGNFSEAVLIDSGLYHAVDMKLADMDLDGDPDMVVIDDTGLYVFYNEGAGNFRKALIPAGLNTENYALSLADLDKDDYPDILVGGVRTLVYRNNAGVPVYDEPRTLSIETGTTLILALFATDIDGDADEDIVLLTSHKEMRIYENDGNGFYSFKEILRDNVLQCESIAAGDMDLDGDRDLVAAFPQEGRLLLFENDGNGSYSEGTTIATGQLPWLRWTAVTDLNNDGSADILLADDLSYMMNTRAVGVETADPAPSFELYPNPSDGMVHVSAAGPVRLSVISSSGRQVHHSILSGDAVSEVTLYLPAGIYLFRMEGEGFDIARKVIVR